MGRFMRRFILGRDGQWSGRRFTWCKWQFGLTNLTGGDGRQGFDLVAHSFPFFHIRSHRWHGLGRFRDLRCALRARWTFATTTITLTITTLGALFLLRVRGRFVAWRCCGVGLLARRPGFAFRPIRAITSATTTPPAFTGFLRFS